MTLVPPQAAAQGHQDQESTQPPLAGRTPQPAAKRGRTIPPPQPHSARGNSSSQWPWKGLLDLEYGEMLEADDWRPPPDASESELTDSEEDADSAGAAAGSPPAAVSLRPRV